MNAVDRLSLPEPTAVTTLTISNGTSLSPAFDCGGLRVGSIITPAVITLAALTLQGSVDGVTFFPIATAAGVQQPILTTQLASSLNPLTQTTLDPTRLPRFLKLRSGTDQVPVAVAQDQIYTLHLIPPAGRLN